MILRANYEIHKAEAEQRILEQGIEEYQDRLVKAEETEEQARLLLDSLDQDLVKEVLEEIERPPLQKRALEHKGFVFKVDEDAMSSSSQVMDATETGDH